jgi:hypothetical protein
MKTARYANSRQKACQPCSTAKAKCDRKTDGCTRCSLRHLPCTYPQALSSGSSAQGASGNAGAVPNTPYPLSHFLSAYENSPTNNSLAIYTGDHIPENSNLNTTTCLPRHSEVFDFSNLELFCPINPEDISNRWLHTFVPSPGQKIKEYPASITAFIYRILKSYAAVTVGGREVPQFVHASQTLPRSRRSPLATCLTLVRICEKPLTGSEGVAADVLHREMRNLFEQYEEFGDMDLFESFQAYLIYSMVLFFRLGHDSNTFLRQTMMNLQTLACSASRRGLLCIAEQQGIRPGWEAWIVAEAKRRTLYVMYFFDNVLSSQDGVPTFMGTELQGLPATASKFLWRAQTRREWETTYNIHLADWTDGGLRIDELWPIPESLDDASLLERRNRVNLWLESVDEFGIMLYAVTSCTHGG